MRISLLLLLACTAMTGCKSPPQDAGRKEVLVIKKKCVIAHLFINGPFGFDDPSALPNVFYDPKEFGIKNKIICLNNELNHMNLRARLIADSAMSKRKPPAD